MNASPTTLPAQQYAVLLTGPDKLELHQDKSIATPGPHQILLQIDAVGICFSDLKLLKQFDQHPRKAMIQTGIDTKILEDLVTYCPGEKPTVPGHEITCHVVAVGDQVKRHKVGDRYLVQTDYRWMKTAGSNAAVGYNFEGGMQQFLLMDERVIVDPEKDESFLLPVTDERSASAVALVEPWACVESSYISDQRTAPLMNRPLLIVADDDAAIDSVKAFHEQYGKATSVAMVAGNPGVVDAIDTVDGKVAIKELSSLDEAPEKFYADILYFGADADVIETLDQKLMNDGVAAVMLNGQSITRDVELDVGRMHYQGTRWIGTTGTDVTAAYKMLPSDSGEVSSGARSLVMGAGGPMGQMHVIRLLSTELENVEVYGTDLEADRLAKFEAKVGPMAESLGRKLSLGTPEIAEKSKPFQYIALMAPVGALVAQSIELAADDCKINIFAGIPVGTKQALDLNAIITKRCYLFGTSGSSLNDMKICLDKVEKGQLDSNSSVDAISGLAGAIDGIRAVENRQMSGKIVVYPQLTDLPLITLEKLSEVYPQVAEKLEHGMWTRAAEEALLEAYNTRNA